MSKAYRDMEKQFLLNENQEHIIVKLDNENEGTIRELSQKKIRESNNLHCSDKELVTEIFRTNTTDDLHQFLGRCCVNKRITFPRQIFQRFIFECKMREEKEGISQDPVIPITGEHSRELKRGLIESIQKNERESLEEAEKIASEICIEMGEECRRARNEMEEKLKIKFQEGVQSQVVSVDADGLDTIRLTFDQQSHNLHPVTYQKFKKLFALHTIPVYRELHPAKERKHKVVYQQGDLMDEDEQNLLLFSDQEEILFHQRLFALVQRYYCLAKNATSAGTGFHAALTRRVFSFLNTSRNIQMECFASPFNCEFQHFCSAFEDTDKWFGSVGSFFNFSPVQGNLI